MTDEKAKKKPLQINSGKRNQRTFFNDTLKNPMQKP
jgi:hypothetical protein